MTTSPLVSVGIVTWNSAADIAACLASVRAQTHERVELLVADNASSDDSWTTICQLTTDAERLAFDTNRGFSAAHNALIDRSRGEFYLCLNPDVVLGPGYVATIVSAMTRQSDLGSATGKLLRRDDPRIVDSTGIEMLASQRHLDRGADEADAGQWTEEESIFGASGAAAVYRRAMLIDTAVFGEYFDEDFFAYREDADLAWRAQLLGWSCAYVPGAVARHGRRVTPERRSQLSQDVNRYSVRNRFLLRLKNQTPGLAWRFLGPTMWRDAQVVGFVLLQEWSSLPALVDVMRLLPHVMKKRRSIMARRRVSDAAMARWFHRE